MGQRGPALQRFLRRARLERRRSGSDGLGRLLPPARQLRRGQLRGHGSGLLRQRTVSSPAIPLISDGASDFNTYNADYFRLQVAHNWYVDDDTTVSTRIYGHDHERNRFSNRDEFGPDFFMRGRNRHYRYWGADSRMEFANRALFGGARARTSRSASATSATPCAIAPASARSDRFSMPTPPATALPTRMPVIPIRAGSRSSKPTPTLPSCSPPCISRPTSR